MTDPGAFPAAVERLTRVAGVQGAMVADARDGVAVASDVMVHVDADMVAALTSQLFRRSARSARAAEFGELRSLQLEAGGGRVFVAGAGDLLVIAVADPSANVGLVRLEVFRVAEELA